MLKIMQIVVSARIRVFPLNLWVLLFHSRVLSSLMGVASALMNVISAHMGVVSVHSWVLYLCVILNNIYTEIMR